MFDCFCSRRALSFSNTRTGQHWDQSLGAEYALRVQSALAALQFSDAAAVSERMTAFAGAALTRQEVEMGKDGIGM
jgi:hypothetical protein